MSWIYDAHIHLSDPEYKSDIDMILNYMDLLKIKACCVSMDIETSNETLTLHEKSKNVLPFIGIHPEMAQKDPLPVYDLIEKNYENLEKMGIEWIDPWEKPLHQIYKNNPCLSPVPSLAIHCANINSVFGISPLVDVKELWENSKN